MGEEKMKAFHTIAIPHKDILEGRLTMDVFAADLWEVSQNRGGDDYKDAETFFRKTYLTQGLENLLNSVENRLRGEGGDPVIQIQTPFGGGKTHALIAMYHKTGEWGVKPVVIVGEKLNTGSKAEDFDTLWGIMERQLTGRKSPLNPPLEKGGRGDFSSPVPPGGEQIKNLLSAHFPVLILMDELIPYFNAADAVSVGNTTLSSLTLTFLHNLTNVVSEMPGVSFVLTATPSNPYDKTTRGEEIVAQLQDITDRRAIIKSPVQEDEISRIIRRRLFSNLNEDNAKEVVAGFMEYAEKEGIIPAGVLPSEYRGRFLDSYPFMPEVVDVLYHRWGSFPMFQRTRGVLRLLSLVVYSLKGADKPYISLADFDLANQEIRQEFLKHIGPEFNSVIAADITDVEAGSEKVDVSLGSAYQGLKLGTRAATAIFLYSFSGGHERGTTLGEIKRVATTMQNPASGVAEAVEQLKGKLFYLQNVGEKYLFSNQPNLNRILLNNMENVKDEEIIEAELELLSKNVKGEKLKVFVWKENASDIRDSEELKLVILKRKDDELMESIKKMKGQKKRDYPNTLFFLYPMESERPGFVNTLKRKIAYQRIEGDKNLSLSVDQRKEIKGELKTIESGLKDSIRRLYRMVAVPEKDGFKEDDLGVPTYGEGKTLEVEIYDKLRSDGEILEKMAPLVIKEKYLSGKEYLSTKQLYQSSLKTPGEPRLINQEVLSQGIAEGVNNGLFGLGMIEEDGPICRYFEEDAPATFSDDEILISEPSPTPPAPPTTTENDYVESDESTELSTTPDETGDSILDDSMREVQLRFQVPKGKVTNIMGVMNLLQSKFDTLEIEVVAKDGGISKQDYEDKIEETFMQLGIELNN